MSAAVRLPAKPFWLTGLFSVPAHREVVIEFTDVLGLTQRISLPFHDVKATRDALTRILEDFKPEQHVRQTEWPRVLG